MANGGVPIPRGTGARMAAVETRLAGVDSRLRKLESAVLDVSTRMTSLEAGIKRNGKHWTVKDVALLVGVALALLTGHGEAALALLGAG